MRTLAETQGAFRTALAGEASPALRASIRSAGMVEDRLAIYRRHYRESFRRHLRGRYPTLEWLIGTEEMLALADRTLALCPPRAPSLAEYGAALIGVVSEDSTLPPYAADVARLDWRLGALSVAITAPAIPITALAAIDPLRLADTRLTLQPGLSYLAADWPVEELLHIRQGGDAPEELVFLPRETHLELNGARGTFSLRLLDAPSFAFRRTLAEGGTLGEAAAAATAADPHFALAPALASLFAEDLVTSHSGDHDHA